MAVEGPKGARRPPDPSQPPYSGPQAGAPRPQPRGCCPSDRHDPKRPHVLRTDGRGPGNLLRPRLGNRVQGERTAEPGSRGLRVGPRPAHGPLSCRLREEPDRSRPADPSRPRRHAPPVGGVEATGPIPVRAAVRHRQDDQARPRRRRAARGLRFPQPTSFVHQPSCPKRDADQGRASPRPPCGPRDDVGHLFPRSDIRPCPWAGRTARPYNLSRTSLVEVGNTWAYACPRIAHSPCLIGSHWDRRDPPKKPENAVPMRPEWTNGRDYGTEG